MAGPAKRPKKPEARDGCVSSMFSLLLQKSPTPDFEEKCGNSPDISKGISQLRMCKFESSQVRCPGSMYSPRMRLASSTARKSVSWSGLLMGPRNSH
jgi:hypothetical protein